MYCENIAEQFGENLLGTWCHEEGDGQPLAPGLDGSPAAYTEKVENVHNLSGEKTIICWTRFDKIGRTQPLLALRPSQGQDLEAGWHLWVTPTGQAQFGTGDGLAEHEKIMFHFSIRERNTAFIAVKMDQEKVKLFCNGAHTGDQYLAGIEKPADTLYIGQDPILPWNKVDGLLQCVSIFDRALTDEEIMSIFHDGWTVPPDEEAPAGEEVTEQL